MSDPSLAANTGEQPTLEDNIDTALKAAPILIQSPGLVVGAATNPDPFGTAQTVARTSTAITDSTAAHNVNDAAGGANGVNRAFNWLGNSLAGAVGGIEHDVIQPAKTALSDVGRALNMPYNAVQHEWRYLVDVEARHGLGAALGEGLVLAAGATVGTIAAGPWGGVAGAELAVGALGQVYHNDSWQRTTNPNFVDPRYHEYGDFGQDIAQWVGLGRTSKAAMLSADGLNLLGSFFVGGSEAAGLLSDVRNVEGARGLLGTRFGPMGVLNPEDVDRAYLQRGAFQRVVDRIVTLSNQPDAEGNILAEFPEWRNFTPILAAAGRQGPDEVVDAFKTAVASHQVVFADRLPSISMMRVPFKAIREAASEMTPSSNKVYSLFNPANWSQRLSQIPEAWAIAKNALSGKKFNPEDLNDFGQQGIYRTALYGGNRQYAANVTSQWIRAHQVGDFAGMKLIYRNLISNNLLMMMYHDPLIRDDEKYVIGSLNEQDARAFKQTLDDITGGSDVHQGMYDLDENGHNISIVHDMNDPTAMPYATALYGNQTGEWSFIPIDEYRRWAAALKGGKGVLGRADDFMYNEVTQRFKSLVLLTLSYAEHIALAELIPNALRLGFTNLLRARAAGSLAKFGYDISNDDLGPLRGMVWQALKHTDLGPRLEDLAAGNFPEEAGRFERLAELALVQMWKHGSSIAPSALQSGENLSNEVTRVERARDAMGKIVKRSGHWTDQYEDIPKGDWRYAESWRNAIREKANDPNGAAQISAERFLSSKNAGRSIDEAQSDAAAAAAAHLRRLHGTETPEGMGGFQGLKAFSRSKESITAGIRQPGMDQFDEWGHLITQGVRGTTRAAAGGPFNDWILKAIAEGRTPTMEELEAVPDALRPKAVKGRIFMPMGDANIGRLANWGFHRVLNPFVNWMSREPIYLAELERQYARYTPLMQPRWVEDAPGFEVAGMRHLSRESYSDLVKDSDELARRTGQNIANREVPQGQRAYGLRQGVLDRLTREISQRGETQGLNYDQVDELKAFADQIGHGLFDDARIRTLSRAAGGMQAGNYEFGSGLIGIFRGGIENPEGINKALIHELFHHLSQHVPAADLQGLERELADARSKFLRDHPIKAWYEEHKASLSEEERSHFERRILNRSDNTLDPASWEFLTQSPATFRYLGNDGYRLMNLDEWFAETMRDHAITRLRAPNVLVEMGHRFVSALVAAIGRLFGRATSERVFRKLWTGRYEGLDATGESITTRLTGRSLERTGNISVPPQGHWEPPMWDADEALVRAETVATVRTIRQVHNLHDRTQWTVTMRNFAPFYFAQEQAYRRMGRLLAEDPLAFRRYQLMIANIGPVGQILTNKNGVPYFVIPHTGFLTDPIARVLGRLGWSLEGASPVGLGWSLSSTNVIFPLSQGIHPDIGPLLAVPTQAIADLFHFSAAPALTADVQAVASAVTGGSGSQGLWAQIIPNTIVQRLLIAAAGGQGFDERGFDSTMMQQLAVLEYEHRLPPPDANYQVMQTFIDRLRNSTRIMYAAKALYGGFTPFSPEVVTPTYNLFTQKVQNYIKKEGSVNKGLTAFLHDNPDATAFTVFQSYAPSGASLPDSVAGEKWIDDHVNLIHQFPTAAFYLMPQNLNDTYSASVYNEQLAQGFRVKYGPGQVGPEGSLSGYLAQLYIAAGNSIVLDQWYPAYRAQLAQLSGTPKYQFEQQFQTRIANFALTNPVWGAWWNMDQKQTWRDQTMKQVAAMFASGQVPSGPQTDLMKQVLDKYEIYKAQQTQNADAGWVTTSQSSFNADWSAYWDGVAEQFPAVRTFINAVVQTLPTTTTTDTGTTANAA